jgi:hypothetical protein
MDFRHEDQKSVQEEPLLTTESFVLFVDFVNDSLSYQIVMH